MKDIAGGQYAAAGTRLALLRARDRSYSLNVRLAIIAVLALLIAMFLLVKVPEARPLQIEVPNDVIVVDDFGPDDVTAPKPPDDVKPEPAGNALTPGGEPVPAGTVDSVPSYVPDPQVIEVDNTIYDVKGVDVKPRVVDSCLPEYPSRAGEYGFEGKVLVKVLLDKRGRVEAAELMESSDYDILDRAALGCAKKWRFRPAYQQSRAVRVWVSIPFTFKLQ